MAANPPIGIPLNLRPPTRIVASEVTLAASGSAGSTLSVSGSNARWDRIQFIITVMDAALAVDLQTLNGKNFGAAFAQRPLTIETSDDILISNPNNATVAIRVAELYTDTVNLHGGPAVAPTGGTSTPPAGGGGGSGGTSNGGVVRSGSGIRQAQTP